MKTLCKTKVLLTKKRAAFSLFAWLLATAFLVLFLFCGNAVLPVLAALLLLSRAKLCAAYAEVFRRSMTNPKKPLFFVLYMFLPMAEIQYLVQGCEELAVRPFWMRIPIHSNIAIADAITEASSYTATAEDHNGAITIQTPAGKITVTINRAHLELYLFMLSCECQIAENVPLPGRWKRDYFSQEFKDEYSIEIELLYCPYATISELVGMIIYEISALVCAAGKGE